MVKVKNDTISVIVPALNEEKNLLASIEVIKSAIGAQFNDYEIIIFDDGSTDNTGKIAEDIAKPDSRVRVVHHEKPMNLGHIYKAGIKLAKMEYLLQVTGDNDAYAQAIIDIISLKDRADMITPYHLNPHIRPLSRQFFSKGFTLIMNFLFGLNLRYYNGMVLHKTKLLKSIEIKTDSFAIQAEVLVKLIKKGYSFMEVGIYLSDRKRGSSKAFRVSNVLGVLKSIISLKREIG